MELTQKAKVKSQNYQPAAKLFAWFLVVSLVANFLFLAWPQAALAQGIYPSGGGTRTVGQNFTVSVRASGTTFDALQGVIRVSGPVKIISFVVGGATWLPGKTPSNGGQFVGITSATSSLTVATITLQGTSTGKGSVSVSGVKLARKGEFVGTSGGTTSFTIIPAPTPPGTVEVSSASHPDQEQFYEATTAELTWKPPANGADGYSYVFNQEAGTVPPEAVTTTETSAKFENLAIGTYYFHIRAHNTDGWGPTTHFRINIKPAVDESLATPSITSIAVTEDYSNDVEEGTLTGIIIKGTGPAGFTMNLTFTPDLGLPKYIDSDKPTIEGEPEEDEPQELIEKYPAPTIDGEGNWTFTITDPVKAGFYKLVAQAQKEGIVSPPSETVKFEVSVAEGGKVRIITSEDETSTYKQAQVAAAKAKQRFLLGGVGAILIIVAAAVVTLFRRKLLPKGDESPTTSVRPSVRRRL